MCIIGVEYLIALGLIRALHSGRSSVSVSSLLTLGWHLQERLNDACVDAVVLRHSFESAFTAFDSYFDAFEGEAGDMCVRCRSGVTLDSLRGRFLGYLPFDVLEILQEFSVVA